MSSIKNLDGLTSEQISAELGRGAKFVIYQFSISLILVTFKRPSKIYFVRSGESAVAKGLPYTLLSFVLGWWGIPWGPIYTIQSLYINFRGGRDITHEVLASTSQTTTH
jgi:hypothetical protein